MEGGIWIEGGREEDNMRYRRFLAYCEERREEAKKLLEGDEDRKREAKRKKEVWDLMRESMDFLSKNQERWKERRIEERKRIKEEEQAKIKDALDKARLKRLKLKE